MIQAAIVAGGRGERMRPATDSVPKPMMDVGGKPLLEHQIEWLRDAGIRDVAMCLGYKADSISNYFGDGTKWGLRLHYQVESRPRGTAGAVRDLGDWVKDDLLIIYGDLYISMDFKRLLFYHSKHDGAATIVVRKTDHPMDSDLVRAIVPKGESQIMKITDIYRAKPGEKFENLACAAVWVIRPALFKYIPLDISSDFAKDIFPKALKAGETISAYRTEELVADIGTPERAKAFLRQWQARPSPPPKGRGA